ncbi:unannotated protein [freshwater metagenome]|uniref:Unannotated protein n=1 Tax=freshwater metagenome TaxID=449393 RepID=A0A6J7DBG4_9ZZZZ
MDLVLHPVAQVLAPVLVQAQAQAADPVVAAHDQVRVTLAIVPVLVRLKILMVVELTMKVKMTQRQVDQRGLTNVKLRRRQ